MIPLKNADRNRKYYLHLTHCINIGNNGYYWVLFASSKSIIFLRGIENEISLRSL